MNFLRDSIARHCIRHIAFFLVGDKITHTDS
jgi:hypothetical protein